MQNERYNLCFLWSDEIRIASVIATLLLFFVSPARSNDSWSDDWHATEKAAESDESRPILVKYEASWCGPCRLLTQAMSEENVANALKRFHLIRIDMDSPPKDAPVKGVDALPTMRVQTKEGELIAEKVGLLQGESLVQWLEAAAGQYETLLKQRQYSMKLASGPIDEEQVAFLITMLNDRSSEQRAHAIRILASQPRASAVAVADVFATPTLRTRVAALDVLRRWKAPIDGIDPWQPETITSEKLKMLTDWARTAENAPLEIELLSSPSSGSLAEADLELDRLVHRGNARDGNLAGLENVGPGLLANVMKHLETETSDDARERLAALRYRLIAAPSMSIRIPQGPDRLASLESGPRRDAAKQLADFGRSEDIPLLEALFSHEDPLVRELALRGLQKAGGSDASRLTQMLDDPDKNVRAAVLKLWIDHPNSSLLSTICEHAMKEQDAGLLVYYVRLLREIDSVEGISTAVFEKLSMHDDWQVRAEVADAISQHVEKARRKDYSAQPRKLLPESYRKIARALLNDSDSFVLSKVVPALMTADQEASFDRLLEVAWKYPEIRDPILPSLNAGASKPSTGDFLAARFKSDLPDDRAFALRAMSSFRTDGHEKSIRKGIDDSSEEVQVMAARALSTFLDHYRNAKPDLPSAEKSQSIVGWQGVGDATDDPFSNNLVDPFGSEKVETLGLPKAVKKAEQPAKSAVSEKLPEASAYDQWLAKWKQSPESELAWLEGVRGTMDKLALTTKGEANAFVKLAAIRLGKPSNAQHVIDWAKFLGDFESPLVAVYPWLDEEARIELLGLSGGLGDSDILCELMDEAVRYDPEKAGGTFLKSLELVKPEDIHSSWRLRQKLMEIFTGEQHFQGHSGDSEASKKIIETAVKQFESSEGVVSRLLHLSVISEIAPSRSRELIGDDFKASDKPSAEHRDLARFVLASMPKEDATTMAIEFLENENLLKVGLAFLAEKNEGISSTEIGSIQINGSNVSTSGGRLTVAEIPSHTPIERLKELLVISVDEEVRAHATFALSILGEKMDLSLLEKLARDEGFDSSSQQMSKLFVLAVAHRNQESDVPKLEEMYEKMKEVNRYSVQDFYWKIRILTGEKALRLRKRMRDEIGVKELM